MVMFCEATNNVTKASKSHVHYLFETHDLTDV